MNNFRLILILISINIYGQNDFKGKITYKIDFEIYNSKISEEVLVKGFGKETLFFYESGKYYQEYVGSSTSFDILDSKTERYYLKLKNNDSIYSYDASIREDKNLINYEEGTSNEIILGNKCNFFKLNNQEYSLKFYFTKNISIDGSQFDNIKRSFANVVYGKLNSIPIKFEIKNKHFKIIATATEINKKYKFNLDKIIQKQLNSFPLKKLN